MTDHAHDAAPPEPKTPMWLPALGVVLFLVAGIWWAVGASKTARAEADAQAAADQAAAADAGPPPTASAQAAAQGQPRQPAGH